MRARIVVIFNMMMETKQKKDRLLQQARPPPILLPLRGLIFFSRDAGFGCAPFEPKP